MMKSFSRSVSFRGVLSPISPKASRINDSIVSPRLTRASWISRLFRIIVVVGSVVTFSGAVVVYFSVLPNFTQVFLGYGVSKVDGVPKSCNMFDGRWVVDDSYPLYNASECPFVEQGFNCLANGRTDENYLKWRWKPKSCDLPRVNVRSILELLRSKRIVFVGDSMSRTQWESLICLLMTGVEDKGSVYEVNV